MHTMRATTGARVQFLEPKFGASVDPYMVDDDIYPPVENDEDAERVRINFRLTRAEYEELQEIVAIWNELDQVLEVKRRKTWKDQSVLHRFARRSMDAFWKQVGGRRQDDEDRKAFIRRAVQRLKDAQGRSPGKPSK